MTTPADRRPPAGPPLAVIDHQAFARLRADTGDVVVDEVIGLFRTEVPSVVAGLVAAFAAGDAPQVRQTAHRLKGTAQMLGLPVLIDTAARIETLAHQGDLPAVRALVGGLPTVYAEARTALECLRQTMT